MKNILSLMLLCLFTLPVLAKNTILVIGDSISAGYGINLEQTWPSLLQEKLNDAGYEYKVVNASISGDTTSNGLARLPDALTEHQPTITIIQLGGNDGLRGIQPVVIKKNLEKMLALIRAANSRVLILGLRLPPNLGPDYTNQFQQVYLDLAKDTANHVIPLSLKDIDDNPQMMQRDGIHPTAEAQEIILNNVWVVLKKML